MDVISDLPATSTDVLNRALTALSRRIARNREIAGLHYPTDSAQGRALAAKILPYLQGIDAYTSIIDDARSEWP